MIHLSTLLKHYKRPEIQQAIVENAKNREVGVMYKEKEFGKRPDVLNYPLDVIELAKNGATSFHVSEEHWKNPLQLATEMARKELDELRQGWDLILDIDCPHWEISKITAILLIKALQKEGIKSISMKFSGNKGFHIGVPFEAFPDNVMGQRTKDLFPEGPRKIAAYLKHQIKEQLAKKLIEFYGMDGLVKLAGKDFSELVKAGKFDPYTLLEIDTVLIAPRHLYRSVYSLHEKSGLVSIPVDINKVMEFDKDMAKPELPLPQIKFLDTSNTKKGEAARLIIEAFDSAPDIEEEKQQTGERFEIPKEAVLEKFFPPCMQLGLKGLKDGRKRFMFAIINFLVNCGWEYGQIEALLLDWNKRNEPQLKEVDIKGHLRYHKQAKKRILPPNCDNKSYYLEIGICKPDNLCAKIRNPVNYTRRKTLYLNEEEGKKKGRKKKED